MSQQSTGIIYIIRNTINSKVYVGLTRKTTQRRWAQHKYDATSERGNAYPIHFAMRKYGVDSFSIEELESAPVSELGDVEKKWIRHFNSADRAFGYNISHGGEGPEHSEETRRKISEAQIGKKLTEEHKAQVAATLRLNTENSDRLRGYAAARRGKQGARKGSTHTLEARQRLSIAKTGKPWSEARRAAHEAMMAAKPPKQVKEKKVRVKKPPPPPRPTSGWKMSDDTKTLMKSGQQARREREQREFDAMTPEQQAQVSAARRGRKVSEETKQKLREAAIRREARKKAAKGETE